MKPFVPPSLELMSAVNFPSQKYFNPSFINTEKLDMSRPALFVGNHTLYGILDVPLLVEFIAKHHGVHLRSLGDRGHFLVPLWREWLTSNGMVLGSPENCDALMEAGESVLVFPGGAREVMRRKNEGYQLIWKKRLGFVRMAIKHNYDIIPFASLGPTECYDILVDADDIHNSTAVNKLLGLFNKKEAFRGGDVFPPISRGLGLSPIPRPQRFYFSFGDRISTAGLDINDEQVLWRVREQVAGSINQQLTDLQHYRKEDIASNWSWLRRKLAPVSL